MQSITSTRKMVWASKEGDLQICNMRCNHIRSIIRNIEDKHKRSYWGYTSEVWLTALKNELKYRDRFGDSILRIFPKFYTDFKKVVYPQKKVTYTTKGITNHNEQRKVITLRPFEAQTSSEKLQIGVAR